MGSTSDRKSKTVVFTGGHHPSGLAVAKRLQERGWHIIWFGHRHTRQGDRADSAEYQEVTAAGIPFYNLLAGKFYRTFHPLKLVRIPVGFLQAGYYLLLVRPVGIVSFGGYLAVPTVVAGWLLGIPVVTHEQTMAWGWGNRVIAGLARRVLLAWPSARPFYPPDKAVVIGLPLRPEVVSLVSRPKSTSGRTKTILVIGGKQGSHALNQAVFGLLPKLLKYRVIHQIGDTTVHNDWQIAWQKRRPGYRPEKYLFSTKYARTLAEADVIISRSGAHATYDYAVLGKKCVLVPIPWVSSGDQEKNARWLADQRLAIVLPQDRLTADALLDAVHQAEQLAGRPVALPLDATDRLSQLIEQEFGG